jgi:hypothetical protein
VPCNIHNEEGRLRNDPVVSIPYEERHSARYQGQKDNLRRGIGIFKCCREEEKTAGEDINLKRI